MCCEVTEIGRKSQYGKTSNKHRNRYQPVRMLKGTIERAYLDAIASGGRTPGIRHHVSELPSHLLTGQVPVSSGHYPARETMYWSNFPSGSVMVVSSINTPPARIR